MFLNAEAAAAKYGIRKSQFLGGVRRGELPQPILNSRPRMWLESQLDSLGESSNVQADALMERINGNPCAVR